MDATGVKPAAAEQAAPARRLPTPRPLFSEQAIRFVLEGTREILEGKGFLSTATHGRAFEEEFARLCGTRHAVSCSSGTSALEIALRCLNVRGGEVVMPTLTFAATAYAVLNAGARPVFVDCGPDMQMDPDRAAEKIGPETRAVATVHIGGYLSARVPELVELCRDRGVPLLEDAAHAHGSSLDGRRAGSFGRVGCFSFFSTKVVAGGEGGAVVTDDDEMDRRARLLRNHAKEDNTNYHRVHGLSARLTEMQALVLRAQLSEFEEQTAARARIARVYDDRLRQIEGLTLHPTPEGCRPDYYKYIVYLPAAGRQEDCRRMLKERWGVGLTGYVYELPLHRQPVFAPYAAGVHCPVADDLARRHICLPIHPEMEEEDALYVADALEACLPSLMTSPSEDPPFLLP